MTPEVLPSASRRLLATLLSSLLGQGDFTQGRLTAQKALASLGIGLCRWLEHHPRIVLVGGDPVKPLNFSAMGFGAEPFEPTLVLDDEDRQSSQLLLAGFWRDRRLVLLSFRQGLTASEFDHFYHLVVHHAGKGLLLRNRLFEEQTRGHLAHVSLIFLDDLPDANTPLHWSARASLGWLHRDLNLLSRAKKLPMRDQIDWRESLLTTLLEFSRQTSSLADFFGHMDLIAEDVDSYDKDELVFALLEHLDDKYSGKLCLQLCSKVGDLPPPDDEEELQVKKRRTALQWIARRLAEQMMEEGQAGPEHLHALVLHKILLYEEIPRKMRPRVASLQVLTSFLADPQKYFAEVENSHSPEVLETRLWRILEMLPKLVQALRFDVAKQVLAFSQRFGPTFDLKAKPDIMQALMESAAGVLTETGREHQVALMQTLPQMGKAGVHLLIELADHQNRSVRRAAIDALIKTGPPVVPILFEILPTKKGWHYLRNMLLIIAQMNASGPRVEGLLRKCLIHPEANVRKEALPGISKLLKGGAAVLVAEALDDSDLEVQKRAAACLALTGIADPTVYKILARILSSRKCPEELVVQIVTSLNRLKPLPPDDPALETALIDQLGNAGFFGVGGRKGSNSQSLRVAVVQSLGYLGTSRAQKALAKLSTDQDFKMSKAVAETQQRIDKRRA